ncbi:ABC transporter ATP-binding protein [Hespellia stercorisuis]|uniref:ABC-2 type transport system ATP-binding protein n=1 Tax=Hespellia stercorisuis DSM 15480 TaxID=1121950 RepID=A0A1M6N0L2_9FIRM|nr:ABC transporter ATP-binding protein [Hespellia stercorisuis]SHJ89146.1 ABC-2 type transport system ATP-binding protein [Hespellia stercorisuis DSM 15480]
MKLTVSNLSKQFKNKSAVDGLSIELKEGVYGLLGANGVGKTTFIQMLCGILSPTEGEIRFNEKNIMDLGEAYRDILGYVPQDFGYFPEFTAEKFMLYIAAVKGLPAHYAKESVQKLLGKVNLQKASDKKIKTFSGGMKKRLGIAQALLNDPKVLILDEPTAGLDPKERAYFRGMISDLSKDRIVILSTHIVSDVEYIADEIIFMKDGKIESRGSVRALIQTLTGKVWEGNVAEKDVGKYSEKYSVVNSHFSDKRTYIRLIADKKPSIDFKEAEPTLEDVYINIFRTKEAE